jgi:hypothetical protein
MPPWARRRAPRSNRYTNFPEEVVAARQALLNQHGPEGFARAHAWLITDAIACFAERQPLQGYPESILDCFRTS